MTKNTPIFYKKLPKTEETKPNAVYIGFKGQLPKCEAHEILWRNEKWVVDRKDFHTSIEAIKSRLPDGERKPARIAKEHGMTLGTLRRRMKFIQNHLKHEPADIPRGS